MRALFPLCLLVVAISVAPAADKVDFARVGRRPASSAHGYEGGRRLAVCFLEGPAADADGNVFFSDIAGNRILKMTPDGRSRCFAPTAAGRTATPSTPRAG